MPQLSIHSWEHGRWWPRERITDEFGSRDLATRPSRAPAVDGDSIVFLASDNRNGPVIGSVRRRGPPGNRWIAAPAQSLEGPPLDDAFSTLKRAGPLLALGQTHGDRPTTVYRLRSDGIWQMDATVPDAPAYFQPGLLIGKSFLWKESRGGGEPWQSIGPTTLGHAWPPAQLPPGVATAGDLADGVWVATRPVPAWNASPRVGGLLIAEAGADIGIVDEDTFVYQLPIEVIGSEAIARENQGALVTVSAPTEVPLDVIIPYRTTSGGTATSGEDFRPVSGQLRMPAGQRQATLIIPILPDADLDPGETIDVEFGAPSFGRMAESRLTISIFDRPTALPPAELVSVFEPVAGTQLTDVPFRLAQAYRHPITVSYRFAPKFATAADFNSAPGQLTIPPGQQIVPVPLIVLADSLVEGPETLSVTITVDGTDGTPASATRDVIIDDAQNGGGTPDRYVVSGGGVLDFSPSRSVLANDNAALSMVQAGREARHGRVLWRPDGTFNYEPNPNFIGIDRFGYQAGSAGESVFGDADWKWLHPLDGRDPAQTIPNFHSVWMTPGFDDTTWSPGRGLMGYGVLGPGQGQPLTTRIGTPTGARLTAYFRCRFNAPAVNPPGLTVRLACDDAVILYLNGQEVGRYAEPPDPAFLAAPDSYALVCLNVHDAEEETAIRTLRFPTAQLVEGPNVLAISLHNQSPGSSDLGLWVVEGLSGVQTTPVEVAVEVVDGATPPVVFSEWHQIAKLSSTVDSRLWAGGSAYANDGLLRPDGQPYDAILDAETGGSPVAPVEFDPQTGHCRMELPPGFFGTTAFTYRVRDKDGWSNWAEVQWVIAPTRPFDLWRQDLFGGGSLNPAGHELADEDFDGLPNLVEFALALDPRASEPAPRIDVQHEGNSSVVEFMVRARFGEDVFIGLEQSRSLDDGGWSRLAWLNDVYPSTQFVSSGVEVTSEPAEGGRIRYRITLPPSVSPADFWRLRVSREPHPMDP